MLPFLVPVLFIFYIQGVLKLKKKSGAKELKWRKPEPLQIFVVCYKVKEVSSVHAMKTHRGSRGKAPLILNLGNGWR
jgi:hypothetical protein